MLQNSLLRCWPHSSKLERATACGVGHKLTSTRERDGRRPWIKAPDKTTHTFQRTPQATVAPHPAAPGFWFHVYKTPRRRNAARCYGEQGRAAIQMEERRADDASDNKEIRRGARGCAPVVQRLAHGRRLRIPVVPHSVVAK